MVWSHRNQINSELKKETISSQSGRLLSLDALRGFDMFWIIGGERLIAAIAEYTAWPWLKSAVVQFEHAEWNGFRFIDLVFPLFLFIAGVSLPMSLAKRRANGDSNKKIYRHLAVRAAVLVLLGMVFNGFLKFDWENVRYCSVLGRIGLAWFFAALIVMHFGVFGQASWLAILLLGYWAVMMLIPVPGIGAGILTPEGNLAAYVDRIAVPGRLYGGSGDPEGLLSTIPAIGTALLGALAGQLLAVNQGKCRRGLIKGLILAAAGVVCLSLGWLWGQTFPINKKIWTSSFVLYAGGWSLLLLSLFYLVIDVLKLKRWAILFSAIGANAIFIYMCQSGLIPFWETSRFIFGGAIGYAAEPLRPVLSAAAYLAVEWTVLAFLYNKKVFVRI